MAIGMAVARAIDEYVLKSLTLGEFWGIPLYDALQLAVFVVLSVPPFVGGFVVSTNYYRNRESSLLSLDYAVARIAKDDKKGRGILVAALSEYLEQKKKSIQWMS